MATDEFLTFAADPRVPPPAAVRPTVLGALRRHFVVALLPVFVLLGSAAAIGLLRQPTYTSEARLNVGGLDLTQQSIQGYTAAVAQLAVAYSRAIDSTDVVQPGARAAGVAPGQFISRVSATPVEGTPVINIDATGKTRTQAIQLANAASDALVAYALALNSGSTASNRLLTQYEVAARDVQAAGDAARRLGPDDPRHPAAKTREDVARLKEQVAGYFYQLSQAGQATTNLVQKLAPAATATSDRVTVLQDLGASALLAGILIGVGLAVWRGNRVTLRRLGTL